MSEYTANDYEPNSRMAARVIAVKKERDEYIAHHDVAARSLRTAERERDEAQAEATWLREQLRSVQALLDRARTHGEV